MFCIIIEYSFNNKNDEADDSDDERNKIKEINRK